MGKTKLQTITEADVSVINALKGMLVEVPQAQARENYSLLSNLSQTRDFTYHQELYLDLLFALGEYNGRNECIPEAQEIFKKLIAYGEKHSNPQVLLRARANYAITKAQCGFYHEAIDVWDTMLKEDCPLRMKLNLLNNNSVGYGILGETNKSIEYAFKTIQLAEDNGYTDEKISPLINLGAAYQVQGDYHKALDALLQARDLAEKYKQFRRVCECCDSISLVYNALGNTEKALEYSNQCVISGKEYFNELDFATPYNNIGYIHESSGNLAEALKYYQMANELYQKGFDECKGGNCLINIASIYIKTDMLSEAIETLNQAEEIATRLDIPHLLNRTNSLLSDIYARLNRYEEAWKHQCAVSKIIAQDLEDKSNNSITKMEADYYRGKIETQAEQYLLQNTELKKKNKIIKQKSHELAQSNRNLEDTVEMLNWVISVISHDVRAPLATIFRIVGMMQDGNFSQEEQIELLQDIRNSSQSMYKLIDEMLDGIRLKRRSLAAKVAISKQDVIPILSSIISVYKPIARQKLINLELSHEQQNMAASIDSDLLKIVIRNLLNNSIKFTAPEGKVSLSVNRDKTHLCIVIEDNGEGINPKDLKSIMRGRYQQKDKNKKNSGIGLGIHLCQTSLKLMNAKLQIESNPGLGTKITVFLPV